MRPLGNWRAVLRHAWSVRLAVLAALLSAIEVALPVFTSDPPIERGTFAALSGLVTLAAALARFVAQKPLSGGCDEQN